MDATNNTEQIFRVEIQADAAIKTLTDYNNAIDTTKAQMDALKAANKQGTEEFAKLSQVLATQKRERNELQKVIQNDVKLQREEATSLKGLRAQLSNLTKQYDELSAAERNGAKGDEMRQHINRITTELKAAEEETQRYYRNVGNYEQSIKSALRDTKAELTALTFAYSQLSDEERNSAQGRQMSQKIQDLTEKAGAMRDAMDDANRSVRNAASDTRAFDALNEAAQLTAAGYGLMSTAAQAFGVSEANAEEITKRMAIVLQTINSLQTIQNLLQKESNVMRAVSTVQTWAKTQAETAAATATTAHGVALGVATAKQAAFNAVANANPYVLLATGIAAVISALVYFSNATENSEEKLRTLNDTIADVAKRTIDLAAQEQTHAAILYNAAIKAKEGTDERRKAVEALQKEYPAYFGNLNAENASVSELSRAYRTLATDIVRAAQARAMEDLMVEDWKKILDYRREAGRIYKATYETATAFGMEDEKARDAASKRVKEYREENAEYLNAVKEWNYLLSERSKINAVDVKRKPTTDKATTATKTTGTKTTTATPTKQTAEEKAAEKAAQDAIKNLEKLRDELFTSYAKLKENTEKAGNDSVEAIKKYYTIQLSALHNHFAELGALTDEEQNAYNALYQNIIDQRDKAVNKFLADADKREQEIKAKLQAQDEETLTLNIENAAENSPEKMALELELLQMQYEQKLQMHKGNEEMLTALTAENERKRNEIQKAYAAAQLEILYTNAENVAGAMGQASTMLEQFAGKSKAAAVAAKSLAVGEILVNQGVAVAKGIKQAQSVPFPANIGAIATTIAAILAGITSAMRAVNSAKFATGGYVSGAGTSTSDSIPARLSNGESVINANSTALFTGLLSSLNQIGGGVPIQAGETSANVAGEAMLARAFARGAAALPAPVVSVVEINNTNARLTKIKEGATL